MSRTILGSSGGRPSRFPFWRATASPAIYGTKRIDEETYNRLKTKLREERLLVGMEKRRLESEGFNIEAVLGFAEHLLANAGELWERGNWEQRSALQRVLFPGGIRYHGDGTGFSDQEVRTTSTNPMFKLLGEFEEDESKMASPRGFEPRNDFLLSHSNFN